MRTKIVSRLLIIEHAFQEIVLYRGLALRGKRNKFREDGKELLLKMMKMAAKNAYKRLVSKYFFVLPI